jgi:hypothetical protein
MWRSLCRRLLIHSIVQMSCFKCVESRLAFAVSPLAEMRRVVEGYNPGVVGDGYEPKMIAETVDRHTSEKIMHYRKRSHESDRELWGESNRKKFLRIVADILN